MRPEYMDGGGIMAIFGVTRRWLAAFALAHIADVYKCGDAKNGRVLYRVAAVRRVLRKREVLICR